jgi:hypothetical protein
MKSILDHSSRYARSIDPDLRKTFARIRREQRQKRQCQLRVTIRERVFPIKQYKHAAAS